jgi:predicted acylesterase/phospholipase RssA
MAEKSKASKGNSALPSSQAQLEEKPRPKSGDSASKCIAIACQGGGAQAAYTAGVLTVMLEKFADDETKRWVAVSGTSGGALSAAVAWYGALKVGYREATKLLRKFWDENSAQKPGEQMHNTLGVLSLDLLPFDFQLNPYSPPLSVINFLNAKAWPMAATIVSPLSALIRPDYFVRNAVLSRYVEFETVAQLGDFLSLPATIDEWQAAGIRDAALGNFGLRSNGAPLGRRGSIQIEVMRGLAAATKLRKFAADNPTGLLAAAFAKYWSGEVAEAIDEGRWTDSPSSLHPFLLQLRTQIKLLRDALPHLLVGAADASTGEFVAFSSRRAKEDRGITADAFEATTSIPWLFEGKEISNGGGSKEVYWDGLFSQNPPITDFLSGTEPQNKPDEIWVAQVNPQRCDTEELKDRLADRRNELSGNLSLNQEIAALDAINARMAVGNPTRSDEDRMVQVLRVPMDSDWLEKELGWSLGFSSKMDRSASLMDSLFRHGEAQAKAFLPVRDLVQQWNDPRANVTKMITVNGLPPDGIAGLRTVFGAPTMHFQVVDLILEAPNLKFGGPKFKNETRRARISWCCHLAVPVAGQPKRQRLEGIAVVGLDKNNQIVGARMTSIALLWSDMPSKPVVWRTLAKPSAGK